MPPRKKARPNSSKAAAATARSESGATDVTTKDTRGGKAGTSRRNVRGRRGGLKDMLDMPLDILFEIFSLMHPRDLLNLARTSKPLRALLMNRQSAPFWKAARQQVEGLPDCPPYLSEPEYANLAFFSHCHSCLKNNIKTVIWEFSVRYCQQCKEGMLMDYASNMGYTEFVQGQTGTDKPFLNICLAPLTKGSKYDEIHYHAPEVEDFKKQYNTLSSFAEKKHLVEEAIAGVAHRKQHAAAMQVYKAKLEEARVLELDAIKEARFVAIQKRLRQEGWGNELDLMPNYELRFFSKQKPCRKSQKLTEHGWQQIRKDVVDYIDKLRTRRLNQERHTLLCARLTKLAEVVTEWEHAQGPRSADTDWHPNFADFACTSAFRALIEAPTETDVTKQHFLQLVDQLHELRNTWLEQRRAEFEAKVPEELVQQGVSPLSLASVSFNCKSCIRRGLRWPQILSHACARSTSRYFLEDTEQQLRQALAVTCRRVGLLPVWLADSHKTFTFQPPLEGTIAAIRACGRDPATASYEEMETCGVRLICRSCPPPHSHYEVFDWKDAAIHGFVTVNSLPTVVALHTPVWEALDAAHTSRVLLLEGL
ncbi:hypothetical protein C8Q74DRAFT_689905 [Fomes fomentarius]|nr:hypothetical protein C8Q74DRAFT_689905 [Fomes fomentarius]